LAKTRITRHIIENVATQTKSDAISVIKNTTETTASYGSL
jgi:adenosylcobinamide amidohydrolase